MGASNLSGVVVASVALLLSISPTGCSAHRAGERERFVPAPKGGPVAPSHERRESAEPPERDPSLKPPAGYKRLAVGGVATTTAGSALVLMDDSARRGLLLVVGGRQTFPVGVPSSRPGDRPLTHDLLYAAVKKLGGDVVSVRIDHLDDGVFRCSVLLVKGGRFFELEARPGDALPFAMGNAVPVFVEEGVLARAGIDVEKFDFRRLEGKPDSLSPGGRVGEVAL